MLMNPDFDYSPQSEQRRSCEKVNRKYNLKIPIAKVQ